MRTAFLVLALVAFRCFATDPPEEFSAGQAIEPINFGLTGRIVNGTKASLGQFPHQVSLRRSWSESHFCGGNIIGPKLVLTAAHCMYRDEAPIQPWTVVVVGGQTKLNGLTSTRQNRGVKKIRIHPQFILKTLQNDVAVMELSAPFDFTPEVHSAPLTTSNPVANAICQVSGWGYPANDIRIVSNDLMYVDLPIRSINECRELLANVTKMLPGMFCAGYLKGGKDACGGDSGGGMICNGVLTGIVSGGQGCASPRLPGVYSNVFYFKNWILSDQYEELAVSRLDKKFDNNSGTREIPAIVIAIVLVFFASLSTPI